jgi:hypothetical protein
MNTQGNNPIQREKECEHNWVLFWQDEGHRYSIEFRFYCSKCLKFKALKQGDYSL